MLSFMFKRRLTHGGRQRGVSMIEALVALVLISVCALSFATLQLKSMTGNTSSLRRTKATQLTQSMADRLRANRAGVVAGHYDALTGAPSAPSCGTAGSSCTVAQTAALDYASWRTEVGLAVPGGTGGICLDSTPDDGVSGTPACDGLGSTYAIKIFWTEYGNAQRVTIGGIRP